MLRSFMIFCEGSWTRPSSKACAFVHCWMLGMGNSLTVMNHKIIRKEPGRRLLTVRATSTLSFKTFCKLPVSLVGRC